MIASSRRNWSPARSGRAHVQGGALFLKSARGNVRYVDDVSQDSWDLNWRAGSNQACFETSGTGARRPEDRLFPKQGLLNSTMGAGP